MNRGGYLVRRSFSSTAALPDLGESETLLSHQETPPLLYFVFVFMALILHRVMRMRLRAGNTAITPERALQSLKRIQHHRVSINGAPALSGVSSMTIEHSEVLKALKIKTPGQSQQLSLL